MTNCNIANRDLLGSFHSLVGIPSHHLKHAQSPHWWGKTLHAHDSMFGSVFERSFSCDSLNAFTMLTYLCRCVIGFHVLPVLSYPLQQTIYRVVFNLSSSTWMWKSSPIPTICLGIHCIEPSFCYTNAFQSLSSK
jgi:hypothetical protein